MPGGGGAGSGPGIGANRGRGGIERPLSLAMILKRRSAYDVAPGAARVYAAAMPSSLAARSSWVRPSAAAGHGGPSSSAPRRGRPGPPGPHRGPVPARRRAGGCGFRRPTAAHSPRSSPAERETSPAAASSSTEAAAARRLRTCPAAASASVSASASATSNPEGPSDCAALQQKVQGFAEHTGGPGELAVLIAAFGHRGLQGQVQILGDLGRAGQDGERLSCCQSPKSPAPMTEVSAQGRGAPW
jgi:hypothetical protein